MSYADTVEIIDTGSSLPHTELGQQRAEVRRVFAPVAFGRGVDPLAHLGHAGRAYHAAGFVKGQADIVPRQANEVDQAAGLAFEERFTADFDEALGRPLPWTSNDVAAEEVVASVFRAGSQDNGIAAGAKLTQCYGSVF